MAPAPHDRPGWRTLVLYSAAAAALVAWVVWRARVIAGGPSGPLDDAFVHLQYARSIAEGHPFRYGAPDDPRSSGATSVLYVCVLAIPWRLGLGAFGVLAFAQALGALGWALAALGMHRLGAALHDRRTGTLAGLLALASGGLLWTAASGMEAIHGVALAVWIFALLAEGSARDRLAFREGAVLAGLGTIAPFVRPEFSALSLLVTVTLATRGEPRVRRFAWTPLIGAAALPLFWLALTGTARTNGMIVKWLPVQPYLTWRAKLSLLFELYGQAITLAGIGGFTFLPGAAVIGRLLAPALALTLWRSLRARRLARSAVLGAIGLFPLTLVNDTGAEWHRLRTVWPALAVLLVHLLAFVSLVADDIAGSIERRRPTSTRAASAVRWLLPAMLVVSAAAGLPRAVRDFGRSAREIRIDHLALAMRSVRRLPPDARVLINDAGVLRVFGGHPTVDLVGLTTQGLAAPWTHGPGSVVEALESLPPSRRPTHAVVFDNWFAPGPLAQRVLDEVTVPAPTMVGGRTQRLYALRGDLWNTGDALLEPLQSGEHVRDAVDVADLSSERAHGYAVAGADLAGNVFAVARAPDGREVLDGGRTVQTERFVLRGRTGVATRIVLRVQMLSGQQLVIGWNGAELARVAPPGANGFDDVSVAVDAGRVTAESRVEVRASEGRFVSLHAFLVQRW